MKLKRKALEAQNLALKQELDRVCSSRSDDKAVFQKLGKNSQLKIDRLHAKVSQLNWKAARYDTLKAATDPLYKEVVQKMGWERAVWANGLTMVEIVIEGVKHLDQRVQHYRKDREAKLDQLLEVTKTADKLQTQRDEAAQAGIELHEKIAKLKLDLDAAKLQLAKAEENRTEAVNHRITAERRASRTVAFTTALWLAAAASWVLAAMAY